MSVTTLTSKGQITMPQAVRTALGLHAGDKIDFVPLDDGYKVVPLRKDASALRGRFAGRVKKAVTVQAMNEAVQAEVLARAARKTNTKAK